MDVYLVYVIYQYDGYDNTEVYDTKELAIRAANQLVREFKEHEYKISPDYLDSGEYFEDIMGCSDVGCTRMFNSNGEVEITVEKKTVNDHLPNDTHEPIYVVDCGYDFEDDTHIRIKFKTEDKARSYVNNWFNKTGEILSIEKR